MSKSFVMTTYELKWNLKQHAATSCPTYCGVLSLSVVPSPMSFWMNFSRQTQLSYCICLCHWAILFSGAQILSGSQRWRCVRKFKNYRSPRAISFCTSTCGASCLPLPPPRHWSTCYTTLLIGTRPKKTETRTTIWVPFLYLYF